jgi:hypothetical protein
MRPIVLKRLALFVVGAVVLAYLVTQAGAGSVADYLDNLGLGIFAPILLVGGQHGLRALAWRFSLNAMDQPIRYRELLRARLGAEALGYLSLTGAIGSQTSKVLLLRKGIPARSGAAAVAVDAAASGIAGVLFVGAALLACQTVMGLPAWTSAIGGALVGAGAGAWIMATIWAGQRRHHADIPPMDDVPSSKTAAARDSMRLVRVGLVRLHGLPFTIMIGIHIAGHLALTAATWSILSMLGISGNAWVGLWFEAGAKLGNTLGALVPARLGVFEAGVAASANLLDLAPAAGIAVGLVRRLIDTLFVAIGLSVTTLWPLRLPHRRAR